jgi:uncharacterized membrane protein YccC
MASALAVEFGFATLTHAGAQGTLIAMLLGAVVAMMGSMALGSASSVWIKVRTAVFFPVALGVGMVGGVAVGGRTDLMLGVFVAVMFAAVFVRRFGMPFFFYGFMGWMGYFFASFLHATTPMLPALLLDVTVATGWVLLLSCTVLRTNSARTLRGTIRAFGARARAVTRACADLLETAGESTRQQDRARRRLRASLARLAEAALMVEGWSAEEGALGNGGSAFALRRSLMACQQLLDRLAAAGEALVDDPATAREAAVIADRLAKRDDTGANRAAHALAEAAEHTGEDATGWWPARHFAVAALEFVALARKAGDDRWYEPSDGDTDFEAAVGIAMGNLPGSPAVAADVPARHTRWNPLARLGMINRQAIQVAVAGGLAILAGRELSDTRYYWAVLAAFIMFTGTATRTETFIKGFNRVLGTLVGLFASIGVAELTAGANTLWVLVVIVVSMFFGFYLMRLSYAYMIFFLTIMLGQLYSVLHEFSAGLLVLRLEETAIGAAIGLVVAIVVTPLSTRDTVRAARNALLDSFAEFLGAVADGETAQQVETLSRTVDNQLRQLALVARPLTRPLLWGNSPPRTRHRLTLYAALATHTRELAIATRQTRVGAGPAAACRSLGEAAKQLGSAPIGGTQATAAGPLADADAALFARTPAAAGTRATDPVLHALVQLQDVLRELAGTPVQPSTRPTGAITGTVYGPVGPLPGALLAVIDRRGQVIARTATDSRGRYDLAGLPAGHCTLVVTEYAPAVRERVRLSGGNDATLDLNLGIPAADRHTASR